MYGDAFFIGGEWVVLRFVGDAYCQVVIITRLITQHALTVFYLISQECPFLFVLMLWYIWLCKRHQKH